MTSVDKLLCTHKTRRHTPAGAVAGRVDIFRGADELTACECENCDIRALDARGVEPVDAARGASREEGDAIDLRLGV